MRVAVLVLAEIAVAINGSFMLCATYRYIHNAFFMAAEASGALHLGTCAESTLDQDGRS
jgi:hypothetical protein